MSKKLLKLDYEEEYDFLLLAIFSNLRDYKLCFEINKMLDLTFERIDDFDSSKDHKNFRGSFPLFRFTNTDEEEYLIISNKGTSSLFIAEYKQVDYFLIIRNYSRYTSTNYLIEKIKQIKQIISVIEIDAKSIKSADNFLLI